MKIVNLKIDQIKPYEKNPRHNAEAIPHVARSIQEFGFQQPLVLDENHVIIVGHTRLLAAKSLGLKDVPCVVAKMTAEKAKAYRLMDNRTHERATWDNDLLVSEIVELEGFYTPEFLDFGYLFDEEKNSDDPDEDDEKYTSKISIPIYEPTGEKPSIDQLTSKEKYRELLAGIDAAEIAEETKDFLRIAAMRHIVFSYDLIAEYYAHADKTVQELMERSALVIIDFEKAIEQGFVKISKEIASEMTI
jgi:hypothetical protein